MTPQEYHIQSLEILGMIDISYQKIKLYRQSLNGIPGITNRSLILHDIEISQAVIIRLRMRLDRLKYTYGL